MCNFQLFSIIFEGFRLGGGVILPPPIPLTYIKKPMPNRVKIIPYAQSITTQLMKQLANVNAILKTLSSDVDVLKKGSTQTSPDSALAKRIEQTERDSYAT